MSSGHVRQRSAGSWEIRWHVDGKICTRTIKGNRKAAQAALREELTAVDRGEAIVPSKLTIADFVRERIGLWQAAGQITRHSAEQYYQTAAAYIEPYLGNVQLQKLTTRHIEQWHATLRTIGRRQQGGGLKPRSVRNVHRLLGQALQDAVRHGLVRTNLVRLEKLPRMPASAEIEILREDEVDGLVAKLAGDTFPGAFHVPVIVTLGTGLRRGELLALTWNNVDLEGKVLHVVAALEETRSGIVVKEPKTAAGRRSISLPLYVVDALQTHRRQQLELRMLLGLGKPAADALVFPEPTTGKPQSPHAFSLRWARTAARVGFPKVTWHALRHTHCSILLRHGVDVTTVAKRLGHTSVSFTLATYAHRFAKDDRHAAEALERALGQ